MIAKPTPGIAEPGVMNAMLPTGVSMAGRGNSGSASFPLRVTPGWQPNPGAAMSCTASCHG